MNLDKYRDLVDRAEHSIDYWMSLARMEFVSDVVRIMKEDAISRSEIGRRMETSQPYVSKALNGDKNFTLKTMIKFAQALGVALHVRLTKPGEVVRVLKASDVSADTARVYETSTTATDLSASILGRWPRQSVNLAFAFGNYAETAIATEEKIAVSPLIESAFSADSKGV